MILVDIMFFEHLGEIEKCLFSVRFLAQERLCDLSICHDSAPFIPEVGHHNACLLFGCSALDFDSSNYL